MEEKEKNIKNRSKWGERKREGEKDGWCWNAREAKPPRLPTPSLIQSTSTARGCVRGGPVVHTRPSVGGRRWLCSLQHCCAPAPSVRGFQFQNSTAPPPRLGKPRHRLAIARLARRSAQARDGHAEAISSFCLVCACVTAWALTTEQARQRRWGLLEAQCTCRLEPLTDDVFGLFALRVLLGLGRLLVLSWCAWKCFDFLLKIGISYCDVDWLNSTVKILYLIWKFIGFLPVHRNFLSLIYRLSQS